MKVLIAASANDRQAIDEVIDSFGHDRLLREPADAMPAASEFQIALVDAELRESDPALASGISQQESELYTVALVGAGFDPGEALEWADDFVSTPVDPALLRARVDIGTRYVQMQLSNQKLRADLDHVTRRLFPGGQIKVSDDLEELYRDVEALCSQARVLVVEDSHFNRNVLKLVLSARGYEVLEATDGAQALHIVRTAVPDLCLLDILMPDIDGYELFCLLKAEKGLADVPIIFLTAKGDPKEVIEGLELGAVDYITKPFNAEEVVTRVHAHLRQYKLLVELNRLRHLALDAHPLTQLPGNNSVSLRLANVLASEHEVAVIQTHLEDFQPFNDKYGFSRGDAVLTETAALLAAALQECDPDEAYLGHVGGIHFVMIVAWEKAEQLCRTVCERFDATIVSHYDDRDRERGHVLGTRDGHPWRAALVHLSLVGVKACSGRFQHNREIADACAGVRERLGQTERSAWLLDEV